MNRTEAMAYIAERNRLGSVPGLENIRELLERLGNPQDSLRVVHIAGTNGKGSVLAYMDSVLRDAGYCVGRYSSPTVFSYLERFQLNGRQIEERDFRTCLERIREEITEMEGGTPRVTSFELETALAFLYFREQAADVVLLETGMGGRLDATNVVRRPICTILGSIRMDHMKVLGDTIEAIAEEKAGILRAGTPCVVYPLNDAAMPVIEKRCQELQIPQILPDVQRLEILQEDLEQERFAYKNVIYKIRLLGEWQIYNAITAIEALYAIQDRLPNGLKNVNILRGLERTEWKGRFEILRRSPYVIRDGAHNLDAARQLYGQMIKHFTNRRILYIIGILKDKQHYEMLSLLMPLAWKAYVLTVPGTERAYAAEELAAEASAFCPRVETADSPEQAYERAMAEAKPEDVILAFGSLYYIGRIGD